MYNAPRRLPVLGLLIWQNYKRTLDIFCPEWLLKCSQLRRTHTSSHISSGVLLASNTLVTDECLSIRNLKVHVH